MSAVQIPLAECVILLGLDRRLTTEELEAITYGINAALSIYAKDASYKLFITNAQEKSK